MTSTLIYEMISAFRECLKVKMIQMDTMHRSYYVVFLCSALYEIIIFTQIKFSGSSELNLMINMDGQ